MLFVVRHGETEANRAGCYLGRADPPLTAHGHRQVERVAAAIPPADHVVASPLRRARQSAAHFDAPVRIDDRWIELDYGPLDLTPVGVLPEATVRRWRDDPDFAPDGVETFRSLAARVHPACEELCRLAESSVVVVVTHVSPIKAAICWALGVDLSVAGRLFVDDAGLARIDVDGGHPTLRWFNRLGEQAGDRPEEPAGGIGPGR